MPKIDWWLDVENMNEREHDGEICKATIKPTYE